MAQCCKWAVFTLTVFFLLKLLLKRKSSSLQIVKLWREVHSTRSRRCSVAGLFTCWLGTVAVHMCEIWRRMSVSCIHRAVVRVQWDNAMKIISSINHHTNTEGLFEALIGMWGSSHSLQVYGNVGTRKWFYLTFMDQPTLKLTLLYSLCLIKTKLSLISFT